MTVGKWLAQTSCLRHDRSQSLQRVHPHSLTLGVRIDAPMKPVFFIAQTVSCSGMFWLSLFDRGSRRAGTCGVA